MVTAAVAAIEVAATEFGAEQYEDPELKPMIDYLKSGGLPIVSRSQTRFFPFSWGWGKERVWSNSHERFVLHSQQLFFKCGQ